MPTSELLIPVRRFRRRQGVFAWPQRPTLASPRAADLLPLRQLAADLKRFDRTIRPRIIRDAAGPPAVRIRRDHTIASREAYRLTITPGGAEIRASGDPGAYYAVQTLRELVRTGGPKLPACEIDDSPDYARRGVYHDCSRGKVPTVRTVKELVERLARWKVNELQLYVENVFTFKRHPAIGRGYSPFTPEEMLEIQDFCKLHHVRLVGSLASFGHMERILQLPQYTHLGELPGHLGWKGGTTLYPGDPGSIKLIADLYDEFLPLHEAEDFNSCCDETWELGKGRSRRRAEKVGVGRVFLDFLLKLHKLCLKHGKRMNVWADIVLLHPEILKDVPKDIVMLNWAYGAEDANRIPRTREIADAGLPLVVCPGTSAWISHGSRLDNAIGNVSRFAAVGRKHHAEGLLNTDWGDGGHRNFLGISLHGFAHGAAHAWNGRAVNEDRFTELFCRRVFGRNSAPLAKAIRRMGRTHLTCGQRGGYGSALYRALVEPLVPRRRADHPWIDRTDPAGLRKVLSQLSDEVIRFDAPKGADGFEMLAIREMAAGMQMDRLASRRALVAHRLRAGKPVAGAELRKLADQTHRVTRDFRTLWMARNKPSRLRDNLVLLRRAENESRRLAKR